MGKNFYFKFAVSNLKKNSKMILPFTFTCILSILMFYNSINLATSDTTGTGNLAAIMGVCVFLLGMFCTVFLFYTNSFLIRRRKKEFGLYNIFGLEKKHIGKIILIENGIVCITSLVLGVSLGILFSRLFIFAMYRLIRFELHYVFEVNSKAVLGTVILFVFIFILLDISNIITVYRTNTIDMLKADKRADKAAKSNIPMLIIGVITLTMGYGIALTMEDIMAALGGELMLAVILVSVATYCFFSVLGSTVLKILKHNKKFYYKPENFTAVSGLMYRIKKNVAGLTVICILSTGIIIALSTTVSMYLGFDDILDYRYSHDIKLTATNGEFMPDKINEIEENARANFVGIEDLKGYTHFVFFGNDRGDFTFLTEKEGSLNIDEPEGETITLFIAMNESGYENMTKEDLTLADNEIALSQNISDEDTFELLNVNYKVAKTAPKLISLLDDYSIYPNAEAVVMSDNEFNAFYEKSNQAQLSYSMYFNLGNSNNVNNETLNEFIQANGEGIYSIDYTVKSENVDDFYSIYGGLLFVGIFLGTLLLISVLLILYYKQIVEGYEDKENYEIMKKVGMSKAVIKKSINRQIVFVFLLPIFTAIIHIAFAFKCITMILRVFNLTNVPLFIMCTLVTIGIFFIIYLLMYYFTSKVYHKIVSE